MSTKHIRGNLVFKGKYEHTIAGDVTAAMLANCSVCAINKASGAATAVALPAMQYDFQAIFVLDAKGDAATNNITITPDSGNINGSATYVISENYGSVLLMWDGTNFVIASASNLVSADEIAFLNGITAGTSLASKADVRDASGHIIVPDTYETKYGTGGDVSLGFNGTFLFTKGNVVAQHGPWSHGEVPSLFDPNFMRYCHRLDEDFNKGNADTTVPGFTAVNDGGTGTNTYADAAGGVFNLVTAAADNDYHAMFSWGEAFLFASGKKLWFEARFKLTEANTNESAWWFGLTDTATTGGFQADTGGPLASYIGALIWKDEATMAIDFETSNAGTQNTTTNMATFVSGNWTRVGFHFDGTATTSVVTPYTAVADGVWVAGTAQNFTLAGAAEMELVFGVKAGPTAGAETLQVDYVRCWQLR